MKTRLLIHGTIVFLILFAACLPLFSVAVAGEIASANNCQLDEGSVHPCIVNGRDMGQTLYTMGVMGWFMLVTIPVGLGLAAVYIFLVAVIYIVRRGVRTRSA
jgi:hypothetical protein